MFYNYLRTFVLYFCIKGAEDVNNKLKGILYVTIGNKKIKVEGDFIGSKDELHEKREGLLQNINNDR